MKIKIKTFVLFVNLFAYLFGNIGVSQAETFSRAIVISEINQPDSIGELGSIIEETFKNRLSQNDFLILDNDSVFNEIGLDPKSNSSEYILKNISALRAEYGEILVISLKSGLANYKNNNSILETSVSVVSSASGASLLSTSIQDTNISLPEDCDSSCKKILASRASREIADMLAMRVSKLVKSFSSNPNVLTNSVNAVNFELVNFTRSNKQEFLEILENDFPGFVKIENMQTKGSLSRFIYYTEIPNYKLEKWVTIGLEEIGIDRESGFEASMRPGNIEIFLIPENKPRGSTGNPIKYN